MAETNPVISKLKIGAQVYNLKDIAAQSDIAAIKAITDALGDAANKDVATAITENGTELPTAGAVYTAITNATKDIAGAMHYRGKVTATSDITDPKAGDVVLVGTKEYIYGGDPAAWAELGDEGIYLTTTLAAQTYVPKTTTIAGIDLQDAITKDELLTALGLAGEGGSLGDLAFADETEVTVTDYATGITGAAYTPAGTISVTAGAGTETDITSTGNFTPVGSVALTKDNDAGTFQVSGTVSKPTITVSGTEGNVVTGITGGTPASFSSTDGTYATAGLKAEIDATDTEMLVFSAAPTATAVATASYTAAVEPTIATGKALTAATAALDDAPAFTGDKFTPAFTGTQGAVSVDGKYEKAGVPTATFTGTAATITPTLDVGNKTIVAGPKAQASNP